METIQTPSPEMETLKIQLPVELIQRLRQEVPSEEVLSEVIAEAIQTWLKKK